MLGLCLGSQLLLAAALGAEMRRGSRKEIGWHRVLTESAAAGDALFGSAPSAFEAFHWHGDVFDLPSGAELMARSKITECQAFRYGKCVYGILFHMEVTPATVAGMVDTFAGELREEAIDGSVLLRESAEKIPALRLIGGAVFSGFVNLMG